MIEGKRRELIFWHTRMNMEGEQMRTEEEEELDTHSDLGLLDLLDLPLGRRNRAGGLRGETGGIIKTLLSVKARLHHHLPLASSCFSTLGKPRSLLSVFPYTRRGCLQSHKPQIE